MAKQKEKQSFWSDPLTIKKVVDSIRADSVVLSTTDTVLGLLAPLSTVGRQALDQLKKRQAKPYIVLLPSKVFLNQFIDPIQNFHIENLVRSCWPGPVTMIFKAQHSVPDFVTGTVGTIAVRVPDHPGLQAVLAQCGPLFSTSANIADHGVPEIISAVDPTIIEAVGCIVDESDATTHRVVGSTILDCSTNTIRVVRRGAYPIEVLQTQAGVLFS